MVQSTTDNYVPCLQIIAFSDYTRQRPVGYFSLPPEIRNTTMELVLVPGQVLLGGSKHIKRDKDSKLTCVLQPPGFQFLATCKQACAEGHTIFYSSNFFFLPPGPLENTHLSLKTLQPQCRAMIKRVGIIMTLQDLTPAVFEQIHHEVKVRYGNIFMGSSSGHQTQPWVDLVRKQLDYIWKEKFNYVLTHSKDFTLIRIATKGEPREFNAEGMAQTIEFFEGLDLLMSPEEDNPVWQAKALARSELIDKFGWDLLDWKTLNAKVEEGAFEASY